VSPAPIVRTLPDGEAIAQEAAREFVAIARDAIAVRGRFTVALAGGSTPKRMYELLAEPPLRNQVDWPRIDFFFGDERCVAQDHPESNYGLAWKTLLSKLELAQDRIHRVPADRADRETASREYQAEIATVFGVDPNGEPPALDLVFLGMGPDGHTASLFPHTPVLGETRRWVAPTHVAKMPTKDRLTMTTAILNRARDVRFAAGGADKAAALKQVLEGARNPEEFPSQLIQPSPGRLVWLVDRAAAQQLTRTEARS
jgi:6-phosphogluconolactonase